MTHAPDTGECSQRGTKPRSPSQSRLQQYPKQLTLQTPTSEGLLTRLASSHAASPPSKCVPVCITLKQGISSSTSSYFYEDAMKEEAREIRKANTWVSQKTVEGRCCSKQACPPQSRRHTYERRTTAANTAPTPLETNRSSIPAPELAPSCPELSSWAPVGSDSFQFSDNHAHIS